MRIRPRPILLSAALFFAVSSLPCVADDKNMSVELGPIAEILYRHPTKRARDYNTFYIEPVALIPNQKTNTLSTEELKIFADAFTDAARQSLRQNKNGWLVSAEPGAGVLTLRVQVTEFEPVKPKATGQGDVALRFDGQGRGGSLHLTAVDGGTDEKIVELREQLIDPKYLLGDDRKRLMNMLDAFRAWGSLLQMRLAELKKEASK